MREIKSLTSLRGLAACWVMVGHYGLSDWGHTPLLRSFGAHSYIGVDLFMVLSGFVLAMIYDRQFSPAAGAAVYRRFLGHRLIRIYPLYLLTTVICGLFMWIDFGFTHCSDCVADIAANLAMVQGWLWPVGSYNGPGWSLSVEWLLNLAFPLFALALFRAPRPAALVAIAALAGLALLALLQGQINIGVPQTGAFNWYAFPNSVFRCTGDFTLGLYSWRLRDRVVAMRWLGRTPALLAILGGVLVTTVLPSLDLLLVLLACALVIGCSFERSWVAAWLATPVLHWLGLVSYSLYMWHMTLLPVRTVMLRLAFGGIERGSAALTDTTSAAACAAVALVVAGVSYHWFEKPLQRWLRNLTVRKQLVLA